jgi:hypothetical protein
VNVLEQSDIVSTWNVSRLHVPFYELAAATEVSGEFIGGMLGHPSSYAAARFSAAPARQLTLEWSAAYPESFTPEYVAKLRDAIAIAAFDELLAGDWYPRIGCALVLRELGFDDVSSSEVAVYRAARLAFSELRRERAWRLVLAAEKTLSAIRTAPDGS